MEVIKKIDGDSATFVIKGRIDTTTAPDLEKAISDNIATLKNLVLDFTDVEYLSSAGLRVVLATQKAMSRQGSLAIAHANDSVMEIFDMTGFSSILTFIE